VLTWQLGPASAPLLSGLPRPPPISGCISAASGFWLQFCPADKFPYFMLRFLIYFYFHDFPLDFRFPFAATQLTARGISAEPDARICQDMPGTHTHTCNKGAVVYSCNYSYVSGVIESTRAEIRF